MTILEKLIKRRRKRIGSFLNNLPVLYDKDPDYYVDEHEVEPEIDSEPKIAGGIISESEPEIIEESISLPEIT